VYPFCGSFGRRGERSSGILQALSLSERQCEGEKELSILAYGGKQPTIINLPWLNISRVEKVKAGSLSDVTKMQH